MRNTLTAIATLMATTALAENPPITIYTGGEGGGYDTQAQVIAQKLTQRGETVTVVNLNGSDEITLNACRDEYSMWIAQKDALYIREVKDGCVLIDLGLYGNEYSMLFFPPDSDLDEISDLDSSHKVLVDRLGSGSDLTWGNQVAIDIEHGGTDSWTEAEVEYGSVRRATSLATRGNIHAAFLVNTRGSDNVKLLLSQGWTLGYNWDRDINDLTYGSNPLYEQEKITVDDGNGNSQKNWAYQIPSFIGTTEAIERNFPDLFDDMLSAVE